MQGRTLPIHAIDGVAFFVDLAKEEFREGGDEANRIDFSRLLCHRDGYLLLFDTQTKAVWVGPRVSSRRT